MLLASLPACVQFAASLAVRPGYRLTAIVDLMQCLMLSAVLLAMTTNVPRQNHRTRLFWIFLSLGCGAWLATQILWTYFEVFLRKDVPNPFVGDVILFLHLVPMMGALALRPHRQAKEQAVRLGTIDFSLLFVWWLYLYLFLVIPWQYVAPDSRLYGRNFDVLYTLGHLVFLVGIRLLWRGSVGAWRTIYQQLFGASLVYAFASITSGLAIDFGSYHTGSVYDVPLAVAMVWFTYVGLTARQKALDASAIEAPGKRSVWVARLAMFAALTLPLLAFWAAVDNRAPQSVKTFRLLLTLVTILVIGTLRSLRQYKLDTELEQAHQDLREDSLTDLLTGSRNRRFFASTIEGDVQQAIRAYQSGAEAYGKRNRDLIFYLIDADCFKEVNDRYGHDLGDQVLVETARRISSAIRNSDALIRWGGDEFLVVSRYTDREEAATLAERVLEAISRSAFDLGSHQLHRSCSMGWAVFPWFLNAPDEVPYEEVLRLADTALYEAKNAGRNRSVGVLPSRKDGVSTVIGSLNTKKQSLAERLSATKVLTLGPNASAVHPDAGKPAKALATSVKL